MMKSSNIARQRSIIKKIKAPIIVTQKTPKKSGSLHISRTIGCEGGDKPTPSLSAKRFPPPLSL
jgi:hypothetical protein